MTDNLLFAWVALINIYAFNIIHCRRQTKLKAKILFNHTKIENRYTTGQKSVRRLNHMDQSTPQSPLFCRKIMLNETTSPKTLANSLADQSELLIRSFIERPEESVKI